MDGKKKVILMEIVDSSFTSENKELMLSTKSSIQEQSLFSRSQQKQQTEDVIQIIANISTSENTAIVS